MWSACSDPEQGEGDRRMTGPRAALTALIIALAGAPASAQAPEAPVSGQQLFLMMFVDQGRSIGYQRMLAGIELEAARARLERDRAILEQTERLFERNTVPEIELEIAQLRDAWNRKQLVVAEKNAEALGAQFSAITQIARSAFGESIPVEDLYAAYRESWEAGCNKGPDEVVAMQAWAAYAEKSLERARQLHARGSLSLSALLEREAELRIARSNYESREARLDRCRAVLFPSLEDILALGD
jgi:hypothetical protein